MRDFIGFRVVFVVWILIILSSVAPGQTYSLWSRQGKNPSGFGSMTFTSTGEQLVAREGNATFFWRLSDFAAINGINAAGFIIVSSDASKAYVVDSQMISAWEIGQYSHYLWRYSNFSASYSSMALSPDGNTLVAVGLHPGIQFINASDGDIIRTLPVSASDFYPQSVVYLPDGQSICVVGMNSTRFYRASDGALLRESFDIKNSYILKISADGHYLFTQKSPSEILVSELPTGRAVRTFGAPNSEILTFDVSSNGQRLAIGEGSRLNLQNHAGKVSIWRISDGEKLSEANLSWGPVYGLAFSPDVSLVAVGTERNGAALQIRRTSDLAVLKTLSGHQNEILDVAFTRDEKNLIVNSKDRTIRLWRTQDGEPTGIIYFDYYQNLSGIDVSPDGAMLAVQGSGFLNVYGVPNGEILYSFGHIAATDLAFSVDGRRIYFGALGIHEIPDWRYFSPVSGVSNVTKLAVSSNGHYAATGSVDGKVILWKLPQREPLLTLNGLSGEVVGIGFGDQDQEIIAAEANGKIIAWRVSDGAVIWNNTLSNGFYDLIRSLAIAPDQKAFAVSFSGGSIRFYNARSGLQSQIALSGADSISSYPIAYSRNGKYLGFGTDRIKIGVYLNPYYVPPTPGDTNGDLCVNDKDLANVIFDFGRAPSYLYGRTDLNDDGIVNDYDLLEVIDAFNPRCP